MTVSLTIISPQSPRPHSIRFDQPRVTLGRGAQCDIRLPLPVISTHHLTICWEQGRCTLTDMGSTNGTYLRGRRMPTGEPIAITSGTMVRVVDVQLTFEFGEAAPEGFTLAESGTMVRQMVRDALHQGNADAAFIEIVRGPGAGRRATLPDTLQAAALGNAPDALLRLDDPALPACALHIKRQGDGFAVHPVEGVAALCGGQALTAPTTLTSRDRLTLGATELIFFDPLQDYLSALEDPGQPTAPSRQAQPTTPAPPPVQAPTPQAAPAPSAPEAPKAAAATDVAAAAPVAQETARRGLSRAELLILIASVALILVGGGLLAFVLMQS